MNTEIWDIIARSLSEEASSEDTAQLDAWKASAPGNLAIWQEAEEAWNASKELPVGFTPDVDAAWEKMSAVIDATEAETETTPVVPINRGTSKRNKFILRIAASAILLLGAAMVFKALSGDEAIAFYQMVLAQADM
jgi:ferric-dicitrate binding protein FerR (iron transport regulator)